MFTGLKKSKTLIKHVSCECKKHHICEKDYIWNSATWNYKNGKYFGSIIDNSVITCETVIKL